MSRSRDRPSAPDATAGVEGEGEDEGGKGGEAGEAGEAGEVQRGARRRASAVVSARLHSSEVHVASFLVSSPVSLLTT